MTTLISEGRVGLGLPQYRLRVRSDEPEPIFDPSALEPAVHYVGVGPRGSDAEQFILWVVGLGGATLDVSASFVVHLGYPGPAYWGYNSSGPLVITTTP